MSGTFFRVPKEKFISTGENTMKKKIITSFLVLAPILGVLLNGLAHCLTPKEPNKSNTIKYDGVTYFSDY